MLAGAFALVGSLHVLAAAVQAAAVPEMLRSVLPPGSELALLVAGNDELLGLGEMLRADVDTRTRATTRSAARTLLQVRAVTVGRIDGWERAKALVGARVQTRGMEAEQSVDQQV